MNKLSLPDRGAVIIERLRGNLFSRILAGLAFLAVAVIHGAIPFLAVPTMGQSVWVSSFAVSYVNSGWPSLFATDFGNSPAVPIAFGLAGSFLQSTFIALGVHPADAYTFMWLSFLAFAFWGAFKLSKWFGLRHVQSLGMSVLWLTTPLVLWHTIYSMLAMGFALLPLYAFVVIRVLGWECADDGTALADKIKNGVFFVLVAILAVFVDGYTFMMLAVLALLTLLVFSLSKSKGKRNVIPYAAIVFSAGLGTAYALYTWFVGYANFRTPSIDFFRGWGVDLMMLLVPSEGISWLWDTLGLSVARDDHEFFGDWSVWMTTFSVPFIIAGLLGFAFFRKHGRAIVFLLIAVVGLYLALGPSLKINSTRPLNLQEAAPMEREMSDDHAIMPTGNSILYENIPGFQNMRATYRWMGLSLLGFWALSGLLLVGLNRKGRDLASNSVLLFMFLLVVPNLPSLVGEKISNYRAFHLMDQDLVSLFKGVDIEPGMVVFAPRNNDFLPGYLAARVPFSAYNIGGDKNIEIAERSWPTSVRNLPFNDPDSLTEIDVLAPLLLGDARNVIVPYFDGLLGALFWPVSESEITARKESYSDIMKKLENDQRVVVEDTRYFALVKLNKGVEPIVPRLSRDATVYMDGDSFADYYLAPQGWWGFDSSSLLSTEQSLLRIPVDDSCRDGRCLLTLEYEPYYASASRPLGVEFTVMNNGMRQNSFLRKSSRREIDRISIPIRSTDLDNGNQLIVRIDVPDAKAPADVGLGRDYRIFGILLHSVTVNAPA